MKTITVKHEVSPGRESCESGGDFWGKEVCKYHTFRTQTHGRKAPPEYRKPKCLLFDCWLEQPYKKCEACKKACMYDTASIEAKKMIVNCLIKRVDVYRDYKLHIDFNIDFEQFSMGLDIVWIAA